MNRRSNLPIALLCLSATAALACVNASYTRKDEKQVTNQLVHLILGRFAHHGPAFYREEIKRATALLEHHPDDTVARNDRAVAHIKLKRWDAALEDLEEVLRIDPESYEALANLGVMYKKRGQYEKAADYIARSLKLKPGGHLRLGDYYLRMARWLQRARSGPPQENFLGIPYDKTPAEVAVAEHVKKEYLITLIKNDRSFGDALLVLGDVLFAEGDLQLAIRAYHKASYLEHQNGDAVSARIEAVYEKWRAGEGEGTIVQPRGEVSGAIDGEIAEAERWVAMFERKEAELVKTGKPVDFAQVKSELEKTYIPEVEPIEVGLIEGEWEEPITNYLPLVLLGLLFVWFCLAVFVIGLFVRRWKSNSAA